ncbi:MAG: glycosyltransferase family 2 protein [Capnocytophaga sp.]|nr:glycosyltransferase family 2 protein [Capnocytophaga sp.]
MVTIAIPFYNAEQYLSFAIDSVIAQTYSNWQLLLVDDGSKDNSLKIAQEYAQKDNRITVFSDGENKNLGFRLNQIPSLVNTKYLARMDADDIMHPKRLEKQIQVLEKHPDIDVLGSNAYTIDKDNYVIGLRSKIAKANQLQCVKGFIHPTIIAKAEWFRNNPYDMNAVRIEDAELWYRTSNKYNFVKLCDPLLFYREIGNNYYKKYILANTSKQYILQKYNNDPHWKNYFISNTIKSIIYHIFNLLGLEQVLVNKRNEVLYKEKMSIDKYI